MKLRIMSDLHLDFHQDLGEKWLSELPDGDQDMVIIAGDLAQAPTLRRALINVAARFSETEVLFVPGNHDYWKCEDPYEDVFVACARAMLVTDNLHAFKAFQLQRREKLFVSATLWHEGPPLFADLHIDPTGDYIKRMSESDARYLDHSAFLYVERAQLVAVTHHMPHPMSIHPKWQNEDNHGFYNPRAKSIVESGDYDLWVHGHTHESCDYIAPGGTRVICNPYGYHGWEVNSNWNPCLIVEV